MRYPLRPSTRDADSTDNTDDADPGVSASVHRCTVFTGSILTVRDNRCQRHDRGLSGTAPPMPYHEIVLPRHGLWVRHCGRRAAVIDPASVHWFARGATYRVSHPNGCGDANTGIALDENAMDELFRGMSIVPPDTRSAGPARASLDPRVAALHLAIFRALQTGRHDSLYLEELALWLVSTVLEQLGNRQQPLSDRREHVELAERARAFLAIHYADAVSLELLADALEVSAFHLCRVFRQQTGQTLHDHLTALRVAAALELLFATTRPLVEIALCCGFGGRSQLSRTIASRVGMPPSALRKAARTDLSRLACRLLTNEQDPSRAEIGRLLRSRP